MFRKKFRKILYFLLVFIFSQLKSQVYTLDQLENITEKYRAKGDIKGILDFNKRALKQYQKYNNKEGIIAANLNIANYLAVSNQYKEGLVYLDEAEKNLDEIKNPEIKSKFFGAYARNEFELALYEPSLENFNKSIQFAKKISDKEKRKKRLYLGYSWKMACFEKLMKRDSMLNMERKILSVSPEPLIYITIASRNLEEKKPDSAKFYLDKAMSIVDRFSLYEKGRIQMNYGNLYTYQKDYGKALSYYLQSLIIFEKGESMLDREEVYKLISDTYTALNNESKANEYLKKYTLVSDSIEHEEKEAINYPIKKIIQEKEKHEETEKNKLYLLIAIIVAVFLIVGYFIRKIYLKKQLLKDKLITEKSLETTRLKRKVNSSFEEIIYLAKNGDPLFLTRFIEVYPDFYDKMISEYHDLTTNEMKFCALLRLNFSSKEIMQYENVTLRTVETRKYRLRKKLGLDSDIDLHKWMMEQ